ncbi:hypothetical protein MPB2EB_0777 [Mycoavidus sp. B2-EB]|nr:hypothetical protein MPB2EB_0777 [Mycoavidus sp. B2-EB]
MARVSSLLSVTQQLELNRLKIHKSINMNQQLNPSFDKAVPLGAADVE